MTNTFITPSVIAARGIATLYNSTVLAAIVSQDFNADFNGKVGDTITIRKPATFSAATFNTTVRTTTWQDATEDSMPLTLDTIKHVPFHVTDEQMTLEISDFQAQLLTPAMEALAQAVDGDLAEKLVDVAEGAGGGGKATVSGGDATNAFIDARTKLSRNKMPVMDRYSVLSPEGWGSTLKSARIIEVDKSASTDALRNSVIGRIVGFETYESQVFGFGAGDRGKADGVAFHKSAVILAIRPLNKPRGVPAENAAVENYKGLSLRVIYSYDEEAKQDQVVIDVMYGMAAAYPQGFVELDMGQGS
jgi:P22 coat protein - gene protein 5